MKRGLDIMGAMFGLFLLAPLFGVVAVLIKMDSSGSVFFRQERIGKGFRAFMIYKFRTMVSDAPLIGGTVTTTRDPRITKMGALLRKTKIDELPQLLNVLKGDMSLVGPLRPEVRNYVEMFRPDYESILTMRPGITDLASLKRPNEQECLAQFENPEVEYVQRLLPEKLQLGKEYLRRSSLLFDVTLIIKTVFVLIVRKNWRAEKQSPAPVVSYHSTSD